MNAMIEVLTIAIGTAVLAALIVMANWDLAFVDTWRSLADPKRRPEPWSAWSPSFSDAPVPWSMPAGGYADRPGEPARFDRPALRNTERTKADEWLALAAAHRLPEFDLREDAWIDRPMNVSPPATPLRDVLAARRDESKVDAEAA